MSEAGVEALEQQLRATPPAGVKALSDDQLRDLADAVGEARRRQATELAAAGEKALSFVPRFLRGPVRKIVG